MSFGTLCLDASLGFTSGKIFSTTHGRVGLWHQIEKIVDIPKFEASDLTQPIVKQTYDLYRSLCKAMLQTNRLDTKWQQSLFKTILVQDVVKKRSAAETITAAHPALAGFHFNQLPIRIHHGLQTRCFLEFLTLKEFQSANLET